MLSFNPRARVGRDPAGLQERASRPGFNPRARVGRDEKSMLAITREREFQSTRPRGARPEQFPHLFALREVSIHAPAWGATRPQVSRPCRQGRFNPRARVGRDMASMKSMA